jgi:transcriptional regulator with XRE-family HTH domain
MQEATERIRGRVLSLIGAEFESDASFEREMNLQEKTVSNWRRGRSASFMKILPKLSEVFGVNVGELLDIPLRDDSSELSEEELELLTLYRRSHVWPRKMRHAMKETIKSTIAMYLVAYNEEKQAKRTRNKNS